ncbi:tetratricopeptide repeat protein [Arenicella xantha]|uniref:Uncharacterized protein n=1 Tax=Arenicella xantha TaxID=644221 RepID=A0A395JST5_9GAMM|nr:hypothetical protein [Arenicella xantha]RBP51770.1 hypothetical protein DFR28_1021203 [Arenicella xantha]
MTDLNIQELGFTPVQKAPATKTFNGIGTRLYGHGKIDGAESLYTKILYFTILFVPILALKRYLVHQQDGAEYILGKGPLLGLSKVWNLLVATLIVGFVGFGAYQNHVNSPEYIAKTLMAQATDDIAERQFEPALDNLKLVYRGNSSLKQTAKNKITEMMTPAYLAELTPSENLDVIASAGQLKTLFPQRAELWIEKFNSYQSSAPAVASEFADLIVKNTSDEATIQLYEAKNHKLLQSLYLQNKSDFTISERYATLEERLNQCADCIEILEPHFDKLGTTNAARILGQAYAANGATDKAYELLQPYVALHIEQYHTAEANYDKVIEQVWDKTIDQLNAGSAPSSFYTKYDAATEEQQSQMVDEYFIEKRDSSAQVSRALQAYTESTSVVPVALDLGIVLLNKASANPDDSARNTLLEQAETTFLSVQNYAGDSDEYQLYLGQVYYWLSKEEKGDELFAALLKKYNRSPQVLDSLSETLRSLGAFSKSKEYALEAYETSSEPKEKQYFAQSLALHSVDLEEKIKWLSKADQANSFVQGDLLTSKGKMAVEDDQTDKAIDYYQQAIEVYKTIPENATQHNNIALIYLAKYRLNYDPVDIEAALANLDSAIALEPEDSIVLSNAASQHIAKAYRDVQSPVINFKALEFSPSLDLFAFLYKNQAEKDQIRAKLKAHSSFKKGLSYLEKAVLLAPKSVSDLTELTDIYAFMDDRDGLARLANRFKELELDLGQSQQRKLDARSGVNSQAKLENSLYFIARSSDKLTAPEIIKSQINQTILNSYILTTQANMSAYGRVEDTAELVARARSNYQRSSSSSTRSDLESIILHRLIENAKLNLPEFASLINQYQLILDEDSVFCIALTGINGFKEFVQKDPLHSELLSLLETGTESFPKSFSVFEWKILNELGRQTTANKIAQVYKSDPSIEHLNLLAFKRTSNMEYVNYHTTLILEMLGKPDQAKRHYQAAIEGGLSLPSVNL